MDFKKIFNKRSDEKPMIAFVTAEDFEDCCCNSYTKLSDNPEVLSGISMISQLVGSMTIGLWENTDKGDKRIKNELSRKIDITPYKNMPRSQWMQIIVNNLLLHGKGNSVVVPHTRNGYLENLEPIAPDRVMFNAIGRSDYTITIDGVKTYKPDSLMHFVYNPDKYYPWKGKGITYSLQSLVDNLSQARKTENVFMKSNWKPSIIVKVDALTEEFSSPDGRQKLLDEYVKPAHPGDPWLIPAEQFSVETIKPLTLSDLAVNETVKIDKRTAAALIGVPPFVVGEGEFKSDEWNNFVRNKLRIIAQSIEQVLTMTLIISPNWYLKFNEKSLYAYNEKEVADIMSNLFVRGIVTGNEVRDRLSMPPKDGLDELTILENYIPLDMIGDQSKLNGGDK